MLLAGKLRALAVALGWGAAGGSVIAFGWDAVTPHEGFPGRIAVGLAILTAAIYLGVKIDGAVVSLRECVDTTIGAAAQFGRESERRRRDDRADLASVRPFVPRDSKGGK